MSPRIGRYKRSVYGPRSAILRLACGWQNSNYHIVPWGHPMSLQRVSRRSNEGTVDDDKTRPWTARMCLLWKTYPDEMSSSHSHVHHHLPKQRIVQPPSPQRFWYKGQLMQTPYCQMSILPKWKNGNVVKSIHNRFQSMPSLSESGSTGGIADDGLSSWSQLLCVGMVDNLKFSKNLFTSSFCFEKISSCPVALPRFHIQARSLQLPWVQGTVHECSL